MIHVVAGALFDGAGRVLVAQRLPGKPLAGGWEFPGGKLEPGEGRVAGLVRELREELDVTIRAPRPLLRVRHAYAHGNVLIDLWVVTHYLGAPRGVDGQALRWLTQDELAVTDLLPADQPIVRALRLPERLTHSTTRYYDVRRLALPLLTRGRRLCGLYCDSVDEGMAAPGTGAADFLVMRQPLAESDAAALCAALSIPVYLRAVTPEQAFAQGASGVNDIPS